MELGIFSICWYTQNLLDLRMQTAPVNAVMAVHLLKHVSSGRFRKG